MIVAELFAMLGLKLDQGSFSKGTDAIGGVKKALGGLIAFEAVKKIGEMVMSTIDLGGHLDDLRQKTGLSAESLQEYGFAAKLGGSDMDSFAHGVTKLARTLQEAKGGSAEASTALRQAGLTSAAVTAALKSGNGLDAALMEIADRFADMPDGAKKSALAMQVFGKSGVELIPTLNKGGDGLRELKQEAIDLGVVMGEDTVTATDELGDNIDKLKMSVGGLKNQAIAALMPMLKDIVDSTIAWIKANKQLVISAITAAVNGLITAMQALGAVVGVVVDIIQWFADHIDIAQALLIGLGTVIGVFAIEAAAAWLLAFWPLVLAVAAIAAVVLAVKALWRWISEGKGPVARALRWIGGKFSDVADTVGKVAGKIKDFFAGLGDDVRKIWGDMLDWIDAKSRSLLNNPLIRAALRASGGAGSAALDMADNLTNTKSRAQAHADYASRDPSDKRSELDYVDQEAGRLPVSMPVGAVGGAASNVSVTNNTTLNVSSPNADPKTVADIVQTKLTDHWNDKMRNAHAGTGGADQ